MPALQERSAHDVLKSASETELAAIFFRLGEVRYATRLARMIAIQRASGHLPSSVTEFAQLVTDARDNHSGLSFITSIFRTPEERAAARAERVRRERFKIADRLCQTQPLARAASFIRALLARWRNT